MAKAKSLLAHYKQEQQRAPNTLPLPLANPNPYAINHLLPPPNLALRAVSAPDPAAETQRVQQEQAERARLSALVAARVTDDAALTVQLNSLEATGVIPLSEWERSVSQSLVTSGKASSIYKAVVHDWATPLKERIRDVRFLFLHVL